MTLADLWNEWFPVLGNRPLADFVTSFPVERYADTLCSALLFPMACYQYCSGHVENAHMSERYREVVMRFGDRLNRLRFYTAKPNSVGGIVVSDRLERRPATNLTMVRDAGTVAPRP